MSLPAAPARKSPRSLCRPLGSVACVGLWLVPLSALASAPPWVELGGLPLPLEGDDGCTWGTADCNACVFDVETDFAAIAERIRPGTVLPAPVGVFPRYVEPKTE